MDIHELSESLYEDLDARVTCIEKADDSLHLNLQCVDWNDLDRTRAFTISLSDVKECSITPSDIESILVRDAHALLWRYSEPHFSIYFSELKAPANAVIARLYETHERMYGGWRPLSDFLNANPTILEGQHGLLISGPKSAVDGYEAAVADLLQYTVVESHAMTTNEHVLIIDDMYAIYGDIEVHEEADPTTVS